MSSKRKTNDEMMPSLHFGLSTKWKMETKCMFCRGKNILCSYNFQTIYSNSKLSGEKFSINRLPDSLLLNVFQFLDLRSLVNARSVCVLWKRIAEDQQLWKTTNFSCKRIIAKSWIFSLPKSVREHTRIMNLMWSSISLAAFRHILKAFPKVEVLLLQHSRFSNEGDENGRRIPKQCFPTHLKLLDVRNVQDRWFDEYSFPSRFLSIEAVAFSQTLPNNWLSILSTSWMPKLKILHIQNNPCVSEIFLKGIILNAPSLESINVQGCMNVSGSFLKVAIDKLDNLQHIDVNSTRLEGRYLTTIDWTKRKIQSLNISFCCKISSSDLQFLFSQLKYLRHLQASFVGWGKSFNDRVVEYVTHGNNILPIVYLDIQSTFHMSPQALAKLCAKCINLKNIRIGTIIKSESDLQELLQNLPKIEGLSLQAGDCSYTAKSLIENVALYCKHLKTAYFYNVQFDFTAESELQEAFNTLLTTLKDLKNFFIGGYPHKERNRVDDMIINLAKDCNLKINTKRPKRVIPLHSGCFDDFLQKTVSIPAYKAYGLNSALRRTHDCQLFYQSGIQKLNSVRFLRNFD